MYGGCWWSNVYLVPRHLKPSRRNRTVAYLSSCIFLINIVPWYQLLCGSVNVTQCKRLHFCFFCDCIGVLFVITVMQSIPAWRYFCWSVIECHQCRLWHYINLNLVVVSLKELCILDMHSHHQCRHWFGTWLGTVMQQTITSLPEPMLTMLRDAKLRR